MPLTVVAGAAVNSVIDGHSTSNGAAIPDTAVVSVTSSNPAVATVPASAAVPSGGAKELIVPVTFVSVGTTTISVSVVPTPGAAALSASDDLTYTAPVAVLDHITVTNVAA